MSSNRPGNGIEFGSANQTDQQDAVARAAYVHVPFCRHRCGYCNFTLVAGRDDLIDAYLQALERELSWLGGTHEVDTLFLGGGTPSHLPPRQMARLLSLAIARFPLAKGYEFSVEANPSDITPEMIGILADHGVNRISLGVQSFNPRKLDFLERDHRAEDIRTAFEMSRDRMASVSLDLIFGVPGETLSEWQNDVEQLLALDVDHASTYGLTIERGTAFGSRHAKGELGNLSDELQRQLYICAMDLLGSRQFEHYEVSNFARQGHRCRHNEKYWLRESYFGAGPGAARFVGGVREVNHRSTTTYLKRVLAGESPVAEREHLRGEEAARERLVFALRRLKGVDRRWFAEQSGYEIESLVVEPLSQLISLGFLEWEDERLRLTREGLLLSDSVFAELL